MKSYILFSAGERDILVTFQQTFWSGIKDIAVFSAPNGQRLFSEAAADVKRATPPAPMRAREAALRWGIRLLEKTKGKFCE